MSASGQEIAPTRGQFKTLKDCQTLGDAFNSPEFMERIKASAPTHVKPQRMLRTFIQAVSKTPLLLKCNMRSVLGAMLTCSEVGLEPNTPLQHAFLIPFGKYKWNKAKRERELVGYEVQLIFGYPGLLDLSYRGGQVTSVHADVALPGDTFSFEYGTNAHLKHIPNGKNLTDDPVPLWAYAHAAMKQGQAFDVMPWTDVLRVRNQSQGYRAALAAKETAEKNNWKLPATWTEAPWVRNQIPMGSKTVFRKLSKWLPKSVELTGVLALDESQDRGTIDFGAVIDGEASIEGGGFQEGEPLVTDETDPTAAFGLRDGSDETPTTTQTETKTPANDAEKRGRGRPPGSKNKTTTDNGQPDPNDPRFNDQVPGQSIGEVVDKVVEQPIGQTSSNQPTDRAPVAFTAWLVNGDGEPIEEYGYAGKFADPIDYVQCYLHALSSAFPADRTAIEQANADDVALACAASPEAAALMEPAAIDDGETETEDPKDGDPLPAPWRARPPAAENRTEWEAYNTRLKALLVSAKSPEDIRAVVNDNADVYDKFPPKYRLAAKALIEARGKELAPATQAATATPTFREMADGMIRDIKDCKQVGDLKGLERNPAIVRRLAMLKSQAPELCAEVQQAAKDHMAALEQATTG